jgi:2-oxoglutarate ferredoxin oxidoreductase subunit alpha
VREAVDLLAARGITADYMRIRGFPFDQSVEDFIMHHNFCFVVEQNRDAQLRSLLVLETSVPKDRLRSVLSYGGFPLSARHVIEPILSQVPPELQNVTPKTDSNLRTVTSDSWE